MMAANSRTPYMPRLEIALAPPWYSFGLSFFARARSARSRISAEIAVSDLASALRITGVISPPSSATATPMSECVKRRMRSSAHTALAAGTRCSAAAQALMMKSLSESLNAGSPSLSFGAAALASSRIAISRPIVDIGGQIEMRDGLLGLDQPRGDGRAHAVERHFLVRRCPRRAP